MTRKARTTYRCQQCGSLQPRWAGRCPDCGEWNSLVEEVAASSRAGRRAATVSEPLQPVPLSGLEVPAVDRLSAGLLELDRVLGGGLVAGSVTLLGGDPGIGKSTLLLQVSEAVGRRGEEVLYVTAEESSSQTRMRARRLGAGSDLVRVACETRLEPVLDFLAAERPALAIIDSIQMIGSEDIPGSPGTVTQVRECTMRLVQLVKSRGIALILVGHVTKEGALAGPKTLEHLVDVVLYFEGDRYQSYRILRGVKNRYGATNEVGVFEMCEEGLVEVADPSRYFLQGSAPRGTGAVVVPTLLGNRTLLVELQALTARTPFGVPARRVSGVDASRVAMILAVLQKHVGLNLADQDVFVNAVGGVRVEEPAVDLGIALAVHSAARGVPLGDRVAAVGEVGLGGELRPVGQLEARIREAQRLGIERLLVPGAAQRQTSAPVPDSPSRAVLAVRTVKEAIEVC